MVEAVVRGIVSEVVIALKENPSIAVEKLLPRCNDRVLKCTRHEGLIMRFKCLVRYLPVKTILRLYNAGKFSASVEALKIVRATIGSSRNASPRDVAALDEEIAQFEATRLTTEAENAAAAAAALDADAARIAAEAARIAVAQEKARREAAEYAKAAAEAVRVASEISRSNNTRTLAEINDSLWGNGLPCAATSGNANVTHSVTSINEVSEHHLNSTLIITSSHQYL